MNNIDYNIDLSLFRGKPTDGEYLIYAKSNDNGNINVSYIMISDDGEENINNIEVIDCKLSRKVILKEIKDTFCKLIELHNFEVSYTLLQMDFDLYEKRIKRNIDFILSHIGLFSTLMIGYGINHYNIDKEESLLYLLSGSFILFLSILRELKYEELKYECEELEKYINDIINEEGNKLIRKK